MVTQKIPSCDPPSVENSDFPEELKVEILVLGAVVCACGHIFKKEAARSRDEH